MIDANTPGDALSFHDNLGRVDERMMLLSTYHGIAVGLRLPSAVMQVCAAFIGRRDIS
jgi:hypothetical protein